MYGVCGLGDVTCVGDVHGLVPMRSLASLVS